VTFAGLRRFRFLSEGSDMDVRSTVLATGLMCAMVVPAPAAPFVAGEPPTLARQIADSRAAVVVKPVAEKGRWEVVDILHDETGSVAAGQLLSPRPAPPDAAEIALLLSNRDRSVVSQAVSRESLAYLRTLPAADSAARTRMSHAASHLDDADPHVAADVFAVLAGCTIDELQSSHDLLPRESLRRRVEDRTTPGDRLGLHAYLLGLCGTADDAAALRSLLLSSDPPVQGTDGVAAGYLLLAGDDGLADLETQVLLTDHTSPLIVAGVLDAIEFLRKCDHDTLSNDRLRQAACCGLQRCDAADLAIGHLAAAGEWSTLPEVVRLLEPMDGNGDRGRACQVAAVRFLLDCRRDDTAAIEHRRAANQLLEKIAASDADLFRRASILSGEPRQRH
jgi:hypothetical protein